MYVSSQMQAKQLKGGHIFGSRMQELPITAANNPFLITPADQTVPPPRPNVKQQQVHTGSLHNTEISCYKQRTKASSDPSLCTS